jgi:hypothetical protein
MSQLTLSCSSCKLADSCCCYIPRAHFEEEPESDSSVGEPSEYKSERENDAPCSEDNSGANDDTPGGSAEPWADNPTEDALAVSQDRPLSFHKAQKHPDAE